jgi:hypothetical protein
MSEYAVLIGVDSPPALIKYTGFQGLKAEMDCDMAEVAARATISDIRCIMLVDEEGLLRDNPEYNELASAFRESVTSGIFPSEGTVGIAAVVKDTGEDLAGFSFEEAHAVLQWMEDLV